MSENRPHAMLKLAGCQFFKELRMTRTKTAFITAMVSLAAFATLLIAFDEVRAARAGEPASVAAPNAMTQGAQDGCPIIFPDGPVTVAPNQPAVADQSTVGIINALCDVTLNFIGCGFSPTAIAITCDTNGDAVPDISIPLQDIEAINPLLVQATIPVLATTPGTAFPLVCCGGQATIILSRTVSSGDDNIFGDYTQTITCAIDLGTRAPVVISASPSDGDCSIGQNLLIAGACFVLADGKPNVTSVFAVEVGNPTNVIQASPIEILSTNLIDAFFQFGASNAGKTFLIYASGPNGTSRNLTELPSSAPDDCPLGNEQGVKVTFACKSAGTSGGAGSGSASIAVLNSCRVDREASGVFVLSVFGKGIRTGATLTVGGVTPKKVKLRDPDPVDDTFTRIVVKKKFCDSLPGAVVITNPDGTSSAPLLCSERCLNQ
jgi:hypothetical protein